MNRTLALIVISSLAGCGSNGGNSGPPDASGNNTHHDAPAQQGDGPIGNHDGPAAGGSTIFTIVLENHDYAEIVGSSDAPYINSLITTYGLATNYKDTGHPSLPNYLHMISGDNQYPGFIDVGPNFLWFPAANPNLGTQLQAANIKWRSYQESMGTACSLTDNGNFATKHDPFLYFTDMQTGPCATTNVDF
jgi:hypothetical protein